MFRTEISIEPSKEKISLQDSILSIGSCFAGVIGQRLVDHKFNTLVNPFGTLYNPASIFQLLLDSIRDNKPPEDSYLKRQDVYFNYSFHSDFANTSQQKLAENIAQILQTTRNQLTEVRWLIITLGTAFCYERIDNGQIVANCHKTPASRFSQRMLAQEEIVSRFEAFFRAMQSLNGRVRYIFTVSPVRHIRDTLVRNTASKASLRLAVEEIIQKHPDTAQYFPSYEIMMDDLRDYRFYKADMIHPSQVAEDYIWNKWMNTYLEDPARGFIAKWDKIKKAIEHRPFQPASEEHQRFVRKTIKQLEQLSKVVDVSEEMKRMKKQLS